MSDFFPESMPNQNLSSEEKQQIARRFRRKANLTDFCCLLSVALFLLGTALRDSPSIANVLFAICPLPMIAFIVGWILTYHRCPVCGNRIVHGEYGRYLAPFIWRAYECPVCYFSPDWSK